MLADIAVIIPTCDRPIYLEKALASVGIQNIQPAEIIIVDASDNTDTQKLCSNPIPGLLSVIRWVKAEKKGAAIQRNQGISMTTLPFIAFMDDDVYLFASCIERLYACINADDRTGGVNALISNQQFHPPGKLSRMVYGLFTSKETMNDLEGKVIGPVINFLCSENNRREIIPVQWLNLGLTIYRRAVFPDPVFDPYFTGYSFMEDVTLSLRVGKKWNLYTVRDARIFHDSQPGDHKKNAYRLGIMQTRNRFYIMTNVLKKKGFMARAGFYFYALFQIFAIIGYPMPTGTKLSTIRGMITGLFKLD
ncbi:MAG: glycosyltransferase [Ferruginibacter sp.]